MTSDVERAIEACYCCIAEASLDKDCEHEQAAYAELHRLQGLVPEQRESDDLAAAPPHP